MGISNNMIQKIGENFEELNPEYDENKKIEKKSIKSKSYLTNAQNQTCVRINQITIDKIKKKRIEEKSQQISIMGISSASNKKNSENKEAKSKKDSESLNKLKISINNIPKYNISSYPQDILKLINDIRNNIILLFKMLKNLLL